MILKEPFGEKYKEHLDSGGRITADIEIPLLDLISNNVEWLNQFADEAILGDISASLSDIGIIAVGAIEPPKGTYIGGSVILRINAAVDEF